MCVCDREKERQRQKVCACVYEKEIEREGGGEKVKWSERKCVYRQVSDSGKCKAQIRGSECVESKTQ